MKMLPADNMPAIMLWGPPGVGKSQIVEECAKDLGWNMADIRLSQMSPVDLRGIPAIDRERCRAIWYPPSELPDVERDGECGILFLDEIANAPRDVQTAALQLVLDRRLGDYVLPSGWKVVGAGNRVTDRAGSYQLASSLANRFIHFPVCSGMPGLELSREPVDVSVDDWRQWAYRAGIAQEVIAFLTKMPNKLWVATGQMAYATPRTWEFVSHVLDVFPSADEALPAISGCVGEGPAAEFLVFSRVQNEMPDPDAILRGDDVPAPARPDVMYALAVSLVIRIRDISTSRAKKAQQQLEQAIANLWAWIERLPVEFQVLIAKDIANISAAVNMMQAQTPRFADWAKNNSAVFNVNYI